MSSRNVVRRLLMHLSPLRPLPRAVTEERGFALIELLIGAAILGTVVSGLVSLTLSTTGAELDMNKRFQAQQEARLALDQLRRETHAARCVTIFNSSSPPVQMAAPGPARQVQLSYGASCDVPQRLVTWCVADAGGMFTLHRREGAAAATCTGGKRVATLLTHPDVFSVTQPSTTRRATLGVSFRVSADGATRAHHLKDEIALRNSPGA